MSKVDIDFIVTSNPYFLKVLDMSSWELIESKPSIIEITLPGYERCVTKYFDKHKVNVFNSVNLEISCVPDCEEPSKVTLPDGIYHIKVIGSPSSNNKESYYLKTDLFDMEVDKIYIDSTTKSFNEDLTRKLTELEFLVRGAEAHLRFSDVSMAGLLFQHAVEMVDNLKTCKTCK